MIPYGRQDIQQDDIDSVTEILKSEFLTQGPTVPFFEQAVAKRVNAKHSVAVNSATSALHISCMALGLKKGEIFWTVPNTFVASANCGLYCGAKVDFVDIDPDTLNISIHSLQQKLEKARVENCLPKIIIPVHFSGAPTAQDEIFRLSKEYGFNVIEDASHAIGATVGDEPVGSCRWSDITVFSFHPVKIITTGEGGVAVTNDSDVASKLRLYRNHGIIRDSEKQKQKGGWFYEQVDLGFNYRMTDLHAALGLSQIKRLKKYINTRNQLAERYKEMLSGLPVKLPIHPDGVESSWHLYVIQLNEAHRRREVYDYLRSEGVGINVHYVPVHLQPYYQKMGFKQGDFPVAEDYYKRAITLPLFPTMTLADQDKIITALRGALK